MLATPCSAAEPLAKLQLNGPERIALSSDGKLYVYEAYGYRLLRLDLAAGTAEVIAGNGKKCCFREGVPGKYTAIYDLDSITLDAQSNVYLAGRNREDGAFLRVLDAKTGVVRTLANWKLPSPATGVASMQADLSGPRGLAIEPGGAVLVSADGSDLIAELSAYSTCLAGGNISTRSGQKPECKIKADFRSPGALALSRRNKLYVADYFKHRIICIDLNQQTVAIVAGNGSAKSSGDGGPATQAGLPYPFAIAVDGDENLYIVENGGGCVRKVDSLTGVISRIAGSGKLGYSGDNGPALKADMNPTGIAVGNDGDIYLADEEGNRIRMVDKSGTIWTVAGDGLPHRKVVIE